MPLRGRCHNIPRAPSAGTFRARGLGAHGTGAVLEAAWPHRLVRTEVDLTQKHIRFFALRLDAALKGPQPKDILVAPIRAIAEDLGAPTAPPPSAGSWGLCPQAPEVYRFLTSGRPTNCNNHGSGAMPVSFAGMRTQGMTHAHKQREHGTRDQGVAVAFGSAGSPKAKNFGGCGGQSPPRCSNAARPQVAAEASGALRTAVPGTLQRVSGMYWHLTWLALGARGMLWHLPREGMAPCPRFGTRHTH